MTRAKASECEVLCTRPPEILLIVKQLGSDNTDVQIGGLYALEGIAGASECRQQVTEVIAAYIQRLHPGLRLSRFRLDDLLTATEDRAPGPAATP